MEESITLKAFLEFYKKTMEMGPVDAGTYSPLVLAYIGDAVYEVMIRAKVVNKGSIQVNKLHKKKCRAGQSRYTGCHDPSFRRRSDSTGTCSI